MFIHRPLPTTNIIPQRTARGLGLRDGDRVLTIRTVTGDKYVFKGVDSGQMFDARDLVVLATGERIVDMVSEPMP